MCIPNVENGAKVEPKFELVVNKDWSFSMRTTSQCLQSCMYAEENNWVARMC